MTLEFAAVGTDNPPPRVSNDNPLEERGVKKKVPLFNKMACDVSIHELELFFLIGFCFVETTLRNRDVICHTRR